MIFQRWTHYLHPHGEHWHCPGSQEQEPPHWQPLPVFALAFLRFFRWLL